ncbi:hypothetical protein HDU96_001813 [Phlyctochytrium bullatum]|nr:hypothetical protein HDU96_001813 [Phlyctochytrium bullatum]
MKATTVHRCCLKLAPSPPKLLRIAPIRYHRTLPAGFFDKADSLIRTDRTIPSAFIADVDLGNQNFGVDLERLPTETPYSTTPLKRQGLMLMKVEANVEMLHDALNARDYAKAWFLYKRLHKASKGGPSAADLKKERQRLTAEDHSRVLGILVRHAIPALAARHAGLVWSNMRKDGFGLDIRDLNNLLAIHLRNSDLRRMVEVFEILTGTSPSSNTTYINVNQQPTKPDAKTFHLLIAGYGRAGMVKEAERIFGAMKTKLPGAVMDPEAHALMVEAYSAVKDEEKIWEVLENLPKATGRRFHDSVYDKAVLGLGLSGNTIAAFNLMESYRRNWRLGTLDSAIRVTESINSHTAAIRYWNDFTSFLPPHARRARAKASLLIDTTTAPDTKSTRQHFKGMGPLPSTFRSMIRLLGRARLPQHMLNLSEEYDTRFPPSAEKQDLVLEGLLENRLYSKAIELHDGMIRKGLFPSQPLADAVGRLRK